MRRKKISWRHVIARLVAYGIVGYGLVGGLRVLPQNIYREELPAYGLKPAILKPAVPVPQVVERPKPKRVTNELLCLAQVIWFESGFEPVEGIEAVAAVVLNRTEIKFYPRTICGVVYQAKQFSWTADYAKWTYRPSKKYMDLARAFLQNRAILQDTYDNFTHFHRVDIAPKWGEQLEYVATYGQHKFYSWHVAQP